MGCLSRCPVNTAHLVKDRVTPESFPRVMLISGHARGEKVFWGRMLGQSHRVTAVKLIFATVCVQRFCWVLLSSSMQNCFILKLVT